MKNKNKHIAVQMRMLTDSQMNIAMNITAETVPKKMW